jgi:hypothetical protein
MDKKDYCGFASSCQAGSEKPTAFACNARFWQSYLLPIAYCRLKCGESKVGILQSAIGNWQSPLSG